MKKVNVTCAKVKNDYKPRKAGELRLQVGDIITHVIKMKEGWCRVSIYV